MKWLYVTLAMVASVALWPIQAWSDDESASGDQATGSKSEPAVSKPECIAFFKSRSAPNAQNPSKICEHFDFFLLKDETARGKERFDRVEIKPKERSKQKTFDAGEVAQFIRDTEALERTRFLELRFVGVQIKGTLCLKDIDTTTRFVFKNVRFMLPKDNSGCKAENVGAKAENEGASVVFDQSRFRERVLFDHAEVDGDIVSIGSRFEHNFDIVNSVLDGDLVFEDVNFDGNLKLGQATDLHGQLVVHGVKVGGNFSVERLNFLPALSFPPPENCICTEYDGSPRLAKSNSDDCGPLIDLPRCPRSPGSTPVMIEISSVDVSGSFAIAHVGNTSEQVNADSNFCGRQNREGAQQGFAVDQAIVVEDVTVKGNTLLSNIRGLAIYLARNQFERLHSRDNVYENFRTKSNDIGGFRSVRDTFNGVVYLQNNDIRRTLRFDSTVFCSPDVGLTHNFIGREISFTPYSLPGENEKEIDLSTNRVEGDVNVNFPVVLPDQEDEQQQNKAGERGKARGNRLAWNGMNLNLNSLRVDGALTLNLSYLKEELRRAYVDSDHNKIRELLCETNRGGDDLEKDPAQVHILLNNTKTNNLIWSLPLDPRKCFSWEGVGMRYATLNYPRSESNDLGGDDEAQQIANNIDKWMEHYWSSGQGSNPPPDPLHNVADHLSTLGYQRHSLGFRAQAKSADYKLPVPDFIESLFDERQENPEPKQITKFLRLVGNAGAWFIFLPTNYGTKPEQALGILFSFMFVSWLIYAISRRVWESKDRWEYLRTFRDALLKRERLDESLRQKMVLAELERSADSAVESETAPASGRAGSEGERLRLLDRYTHLPQNDEFYLDVDKGCLHYPKNGKKELSFGEVMHISGVSGFMQYDRNRQPQHFSIFRYAIDAMIPVIDLHAYSQYYPAGPLVRFVAVLQHLIGWWVLTSFLASLAVL